jgi:hypothetical protein
MRGGISKIRPLRKFGLLAPQNGGRRSKDETGTIVTRPIAGIGR